MLCQVLCHVLSVLLQVDFCVIQVTIGVTKFVNVDVKTLVLLGNIHCENYPSFELHNHFVSCHIF